MAEHPPQQDRVAQPLNRATGQAAALPQIPLQRVDFFAAEVELVFFLIGAAVAVGRGKRAQTQFEGVDQFLAPRLADVTSHRHPRLAQPVHRRQGGL